MRTEPSPAPSAQTRRGLRSSARTGPFLEALTSPGPLRTLELRPPPAGLGPQASVDAWIDLNQAVRSLLRAGRFVLFTDDAVGDREEESLQHLTSNLGKGTGLSQVIPFLTCKHTLDYCGLFARRAASHGFGALTITGGDRALGPPRCVPRSRDLRRILREQVPGLPLGAWVNPYREAAEQVDLLLDPDHEADFFLTQVVSHHALGPVDRFLDECTKRGVTLPGMMGVFYYRSANPRTLRRLSDFIPVPVEGITQDFAAGASAELVCARTISALEKRGVEKVYVSNLALRGVEAGMRRIEALV